MYERVSKGKCVVRERKSMQERKIYGYEETKKEKKEGEIEKWRLNKKNHEMMRFCLRLPGH